MLEVLEWYAPWARIDAGLKLELLLWLASIVAAVYIYLRVIVFDRPWLPLDFARDDDGAAGSSSGGATPAPRHPPDSSR